MRTGALEWASATYSRPGQTECGDRCVVAEVPGGVLVAVVDGSGHGPAAAAAADCALAAVSKHAGSGSLPLIMERCHTSLRETRGAVMSMATVYADGALTWLGVGNVEGRILRAKMADPRRAETLLLMAGLLGQRLPTLMPSKVTLARQDVLILATDGIEPEFADGINAGIKPQVIADNIISRHGKKSDDALVLVARYAG